MSCTINPLPCTLGPRCLLPISIGIDSCQPLLNTFWLKRISPFRFFARLRQLHVFTSIDPSPGAVSYETDWNGHLTRSRNCPEENPLTVLLPCFPTSVPCPESFTPTVTGLQHACLRKFTVTEHRIVKDFPVPFQFIDNAAIWPQQRLMHCVVFAYNLSP